MSKINIEIVCVVAEKQKCVSLSVPMGTTAKEAIVLSQLAQEFSQINLDHLDIGVYSEKITEDYILSDNDRIEIYQPLLLDPKDLRRQKALIAEKRKKNKNVSN